MRKAAGSLGTDPPDAAAAIALTSESPGEAAAEHAGEPRASSVRKAAGRSAAHPLGRGSETAALAEGGRPSKPRPNPSGSRCEEAGGTDAPTAVGGNSCAPGSTPGAVGAARCWGDTLHHEAARDASPLPPTAPPPSPAAPPPSLALLPPAPAPAPRRRSPTPPPLPPLRRASSVRKAAGSASPLPKDDGGSANDGSADRAGGEAWVCSAGSCAPGSAPGGVGVAGCTPPCVYGSDAAASTGVLPRPEIPSIALSEVERESSSLCSLVVRASPPQPSSVWEASCAASDATRRGVSASPLPPSETAAAHASGPSSEAGATSSPALGAASPKAACAVNGEGASVGAGVGTAAGAAATALPPRPGGSESRAPRPSATALSALEAGGGTSRAALLWPASASPPMPGCAAASAAALSTLSTVESTEAEPAIQAHDLAPTAVGSAALFTSPLGRASFGGGSIALPRPAENPRVPSGPLAYRSARIWRAGEGAGQKLCSQGNPRGAGVNRSWRAPFEPVRGELRVDMNRAELVGDGEDPVSRIGVCLEVGAGGLAARRGGRDGGGSAPFGSAPARRE